ncbi:MAG: hypothetical protein EOP45_05220 [Sphingobacteriaceae bacterium]|nr:MAG: hypothetical protein EOP45_05220 [Sphingobacteriaceae bacterium]
MKSRIKILLMLPFLFILLAISCKKDGLPKATQSGENTMAANVDGKPWQMKACVSCTGGGTGLIVTYEDRNFFAVTGEDHNFGLQIAIAIKSLKNVGIYNLSSRNLDFARLYKNNSAGYYYTTTKNVGQVTITKLDLTNQIISGTFDLTAEDESNPANTIKVTDGRFDVKFR